ESATVGKPDARPELAAEPDSPNRDPVVSVRDRPSPGDLRTTRAPVTKPPGVARQDSRRPRRQTATLPSRLANAGAELLPPPNLGKKSRICDPAGGIILLMTEVTRILRGSLQIDLRRIIRA